MSPGSSEVPRCGEQLHKVIQRKLVAYKRQDAAKGLRFNLKVDHILELKEAQSNRCAACNIELLWPYQPKDTQQFSVARLDNTNGTLGHTRDNTRLTCLECNRIARLVKELNANARGDVLLFETKRVSRDYRGGFLCAAA